MSFDRVKQFLSERGFENRVREFSVSSATVELAAQAAGVIPARIAKTLSFQQGDGCLLVVTAGDTKIDNAKFKTRFGMKATMLPSDRVQRLLGQTVGGVCPFALPEGVPVYLDQSMRRFDTVFPACGSANSAVALTCDELYTVSGAQDWVDVVKFIEG